MILIQADNLEFTIKEGKWFGDDLLLAGTLEAIAESYPFKDSGYLPDPIHNSVLFALKEAQKNGIIENWKILKNTKPVSSDFDNDDVY